MGLLVGTCAAIALRILGFAPGIRLSSLELLFPVAYAGFVLNVLSGVLLLIGFPSKHLTNPVFYLKLVCIAIAVADMARIRERVVRGPAADLRLRWSAKTLACAALLFWAGSIVTGRLLYYTFTRLDPFGNPY
jgi:hypothetical protein